MPYGIGDDCLQARFKRLIPETCVHHPPARPEAYVEGKDPNCSLPRQRVSQIFKKFANLGENRDSSRTLHVGAINSESHTGRQFLPIIIPPSTVTLLTAAKSHVHGKDLECLPLQQCVSQIFEKFADLGENRGSSRTLHVETTNLESCTGRQPLPSTTSPTITLTPSTHLESRVRGEDPDCSSPRQSVVTGLGPGYIIPGPWPELTPLALWFRQEPPLFYCK